MHKKITFGFLFCFLLFSLINPSAKAQQVNKAMALFLENKISEAEMALLKIANDEKNPERGKAGVALAVLYKFNENDEEKVKYYVKGIQQLDNPDPYIFTFWGNCRFVNYPVLGEEVLRFYASRKQIHPDIQYVIHHQKRSRFERSNRYDDILSLNKNAGYVERWELLGSFDYGDGYGFYNNEGALAHPENTYEFTGINGGKIRWFPMPDNMDQSRIFYNDFIDMNNSGKSYMQTFIQSPKEQEILINMVSGSDVRCWVNDALVLENRKNIECIYSLPFRVKVKLKAGNNRLLLQLGKKTSYRTNIEVYCTDTNYVPLNNLAYQINDKQYATDNSKPATITDPDIESFNALAFAEYTQTHPQDWLEQILRVEELNSNDDKTKTLKALKSLRQAFPNSYYLTNLYYNNKPNVSYGSKDEYLNQNCADCFATLMQKYNDAKNDNTKEKTKEALAKLEKMYPNNYTVLMTKIEKLIDDNEYAEAEKLIEEGIKKYDNKIALYNNKSFLLSAQGKKDDNAVFLRSILPDMTNTTFSNKLANYYLDKNDTLNWLRISQEDMKYSISDQDYYTLSNMYKSSKKYDSAEMVMKELLVKKPFSALVMERYGDLLVDKGDKKGALEYFKKSLAYFPQDYDLIKKMRDNTSEKMELEILAPQTLKELFNEKKISKVAIPPYLSQKSWVVLMRKEVSITYEGAYTKGKTYYFYKILNEAGIKEFKEVSNNGSSSELLVFKENGEINLPEGYGTWVLPDLKVGDIIGIKEESGIRNGGIKTTLYQNYIDINNNAPVIDIEHQMLIHKNLHIKPALFGNTADFAQQQKEWSKDFDLYTFTAHHPTFAEQELSSLDPYANQTYVALSNYPSWNEIAKWYWDIASPTLVKNDSITRIAATVLKDHQKDSEYEKAKLLYDWLEDHINYSSQSFRQDNYVPQMPDKIVEDKLGDCKDMAALYLLLCREAGIKGNFVLVNMDNNATALSRYVGNAFNHCIAKIYPDGKPLYVELTAKYLPFAHNASYASFAYGLEVDSTRICSTAPVFNEGKGDYINIGLNINVDSSNGVHITEHIAATGVTSSYLKEAFEKADSTQINTALLKLISSMMPNSKMHKGSYNAKEKDNDTLKIDYLLGNNDLYIDVAELQIYKVPSSLNKLIDESIFANKTRKTDLNFSTLSGYLAEVDNNVTVEIPKGKTLYKVPTDMQLSNPFFDFEIKYKLSADNIKVSKHFLIKKMIVPANEFTAFKTEMEKAYKSDLVTLVMQ